MDPGSNKNFYNSTSFLLYLNMGKICVHSNLVLEHASLSDLYSILCYMEKTKKQ